MDLEPPQILGAIAFGIVLGALLNAVAAALEALGRVGLVAVAETNTSLSRVAERVLDRGPRIRDALLAIRVGCVAATSALAAVHGIERHGRVGAAIGVFLVAACYVVLAQIAAAIARRRPSTVALQLLRLMRPLEWVLLPFTLPLGWVRSSIEQLLPLKAPPGTEPERLAEIAVEQVLEQSEAVGSIAEEQAELFWNLLEFKNTIAREIMVPRTRVVAFDIDTPISDVVARVIETQHSRYPVYRGSLDQVLGVLFTKDLFRAIRDTGESSVSLVSVIRRPVYMVPEDKKIGEVLRSMQKNRIHLAVVTDEFGGANGILTLEDIVEEIVGEIQDEHDEEEPQARETEPGRVVADASLGIFDLAEQFGVALPRDDDVAVDSIGGLVAHVAGRVPRVGEIVAIGDFDVHVLAGDRQRVTTVEIRRRPPPERPEPSEAA